MATFAEIIKKKQKEWDCPDLMDKSHQSRGARIPYSSPMMNHSTYGGIPRDRAIEYYGEPGGGKSTTAVDNCKQAYRIFAEEFEAQVAELRVRASQTKSAAGELEDLLDRGPKKVLYIDLENAFDDDWCKVLGLDPNEIEIMTPPNIVAEDVLETILELIETGEVGFLVLDSIPSLVPKSELEKKIGERTVAALAGLLNVFYRKIIPMLTRYGCTFLAINQIRDNMDNPYDVQTPGGKAPKFYASLRILFQKGKPVDFLGNELPMNAEDPAGYIIKAKITKQKTAPNDRKVGTYYLMAKSGIREDFDYAQLAVNKYGVIRKSGGWFTVCDPFTGEVLSQPDGRPLKINGMARVYDFLKDDSEYYSKLKKFILKDINGEEDEADFEEDTEIQEEVNSSDDNSVLDSNNTDSSAQSEV